MPTSSDSDIRPLASRILLVQTGAGAAVALVCLLVWGRYACVSALAGAGTGVVANMYMTFKALQPARTPRRALGQLYLGQLVKVGLTVALFMLAARMPHAVVAGAADRLPGDAGGVLVGAVCIGPAHADGDADWEWGRRPQGTVTPNGC